MKTIRGLISGVAGAVTLTAVHQTLKNYVKDAPRVDLIGTNGIKKVFSRLNMKRPSKKVMYNLSLAGDLLFNSFYYSLTAAGKKPLINGALLGLGAGTGVVTLPKSLNIGQHLAAKNVKQALLSFSVYLSGGLAAAAVYKLLEKA